MTNMNEKTGIRYGVLSHGIGQLYELFMYYGTNVSYEAAEKGWRDRLGRCSTDGERIEVVGEDVWQCAVESSKGEDVDLVAYLMQDWECDEPEYAYERDGFKALLTYLGGAHVVYVIRSRYVAWCRPCSPCCPNAGNLDEMSGDSHVLAYCFDPEDHEEAASFVLTPFRDGLTLVSRKED